MRILIATLALAMVAGGCFARSHEPLTAADKLHFIDCRDPVMTRVCPGREDCEPEARARLEAVPQRDRLRWLEDNGCPAQVIARREEMLARWQAESKQPVSGSTQLRWQIDDTLGAMACVIVLPLCLARQATRPR